MKTTVVWDMDTVSDISTEPSRSLSPANVDFLNPNVARRSFSCVENIQKQSWVCISIHIFFNLLSCLWYYATQIMKNFLKRLI